MLPSFETPYSDDPFHVPPVERSCAWHKHTRSDRILVINCLFGRLGMGDSGVGRLPYITPLC